MAGYDWEAIKAANPLADVVGKTVALKQRGDKWRGLCPFHGENSPSFYVYPDEQYHCYGCGAHGDVVDFVSQMQGVDATNAVRLLNGGSASVTAEHKAIATERQEQRKRDKAAAIVDAKRRWKNSFPADPTHAYLVRKGIEHGPARMEGYNLILPIYDADGEIQAVQIILPDVAKSNKFFPANATIEGGRLNIGIHLGRTILCEGFATGMSIYDAIPDQVCVAFSGENLLRLAQEFHDTSVPFIIAADHKGLAKVRAFADPLGIPIVVSDEGDDFNDQAAALGVDSVASTFRRQLLEYARAKEAQEREKQEETDPVDVWKRHAPPELPHGLLPDVLERFARVRAPMMGIDAGGLAMAALTVCGAVIRDSIKVKVKRHENWTESARIWTVLVGDPSYKKSPILRAAAGRISKMDGDLVRQHGRDLQRWKDMDKQGEAPVPTRLRIEDITMEAAQEVARHSPDGVLALQDELSGWFGGIEKYSGGKGGAKDRAFWLRAFGGGEYAVNRVGRESFLIDNLSISILGAIQPDPIRRIMSDATDDGLIQRFFPIVLSPSGVDQDEEAPDVASEYDDLITGLHAMRAPQSIVGDMLLEFDDDARAVREALARKHHAMAVSCEGFNKKLSAHFGKFDGLFPRLCVIWHVVEHVGRELPVMISGDTARRVDRFLSTFLLRHSMTFYSEVLGIVDEQEEVQAMAGYILANRLESVTMRTLARGSRSLRKLTREEGARVFEKLEAFGWLEQANKRSDAPSWEVNPRVHEIFAAKAEEEKIRRGEQKEIISRLLSGDGW